MNNLFTLIIIVYCTATEEVLSNDIPWNMEQIFIQPQSIKPSVVGETLKVEINEQTCPNNKTKCKDTKTCCITKHGNYYCCPHKNAVCCSDKYQCCPENTTCDLKNKKCTKSLPMSSAHIPFNYGKSFDSRLIFVPRDEKYCPDQRSKCPGKKNCCTLYNGNFGCCPFNHGVCCPDLKTCCPHETLCDIKKNRCVAVNKELIPIKTLSRKSRLGKDICPDNVSECFSWQTCCLAKDNSYGCCPFQNGTCCADRNSCCRENEKCDLKTNSCISPKRLGYNQRDQTYERRSLISLFTDIGLENSFSKNDKCPNNHRYCSMGNNLNGCCPYTFGVCCSDLRTCCPNGTRCTLSGCQ